MIIVVFVIVRLLSVRGSLPFLDIERVISFIIAFPFDHAIVKNFGFTPSVGLSITRPPRMLSIVVLVVCVLSASLNLCSQDGESLLVVIILPLIPLFHARWAEPVPSLSIYANDWPLLSEGEPLPLDLP